MNEKLRTLCVTALGIALYVALSMTVQVPIIGHASLDLGYIVFAVYCYHFGPVSGAFVGSVGCLFVSLLKSGWFPIGWILGNMVIGFIAGSVREASTSKRIIAVFLSTFIGIFFIKTIVECSLYSIPIAVKAPKSAVVFLMDAIVMSIGTWIAPKIPIQKKNK